MITFTYLNIRRPFDQVPWLAEIDLVSIPEPNEHGLVLIPDGAFWIDPNQLWWVASAQRYLKARSG